MRILENTLQRLIFEDTKRIIGRRRDTQKQLTTIPSQDLSQSVLNAIAERSSCILYRQLPDTLALTLSLPSISQCTPSFFPS